MNRLASRSKLREKSQPRAESEGEVLKGKRTKPWRMEENHSRRAGERGVSAFMCQSFVEKL